MGKCMFYVLFPFNILFYIHKCADFIYNQAACLCLVPQKVRWREPGLQVIVTHHMTARNWIWFSERAVCVLNCLAAFHLFIYIFKLWEMQGNIIIPVTEYEVLTYHGLSRLRDPYLNTWSPVYSLFAEFIGGLGGGYFLMWCIIVKRLEFLEPHTTPCFLSLLPGYTLIKMFIPLCIYWLLPWIM